MTNLKKKVLVISLVISIIAILSMGTLAWFQDQASVDNKFLMTDSETDPDEIFSVDLWEDKVNPDGTPVDPKEKTDENTYDDIVPGDRLHKNPTVENTGKHAQWIRVTVTLNHAEAWIATLGDDYDLGTIFEGHDETVWTRYEDGKFDAVQNTLTMTYYLNDKLDVAETAELFKAVVIPSTLDQADFITIGNEFDLNIVAQALQYENTGNTCYEAFTNCWAD